MLAVEVYKMLLFIAGCPPKLSNAPSETTKPLWSRESLQRFTFGRKELIDFSFFYVFIRKVLYLFSVLISKF